MQINNLQIDYLITIKVYSTQDLPKTNKIVQRIADSYKIR